METLHPGLYIQEVKGAPPMEGVSTATGAFIGITEKGIPNKATLVTNWTEFVTNFGGFLKDSYLAYAVKGFFENGGTRAYINRVVHYEKDAKTSKPAKLEIKGTDDAAIGSILASSDGSWGNEIEAQLDVDKDSKVSLKVTYKGETLEYTADNLVTLANDLKENPLVHLDLVDEEKAAKSTSKTKLEGGDDGLTGITDTDYVGDSALGTGLYAFDGVDINLLSVAGVTTQAVHVGAITYVENRKDCFAILDLPMGLGVTKTKEYVSTNNLVSEFAGAYTPFLKVSDPIGQGKNPKKLVPPSGHVMGAVARVDNSRGVWKAPAGTEAKLNGVLGVERIITDTHRDILNPACINSISPIEDSGICVWGTRTLSKGEYKYIPVRRLVLYIESSIRKNLKWAVFEPNTEEALWGKVRTAVSSFLEGIWSSGGLKGASKDEAFFVKCDSELNTKQVVDEGKTYVDIGVAPVKPAEFIIFRISLR